MGFSLSEWRRRLFFAHGAYTSTELNQIENG